MRLSAVLVSLIILSACASSKKSTTMEPDFADNVVIAHRGAWKLKNHPENSIAALKEAISLKCTGSEFDVHLTKDDSLVINHDHDYFGMPIGTTEFSTLYQQKLPNGETIPTLREYLLAGLENNRHTRLVIELKPSKVGKDRARLSAEKAVALVRELNAEPMVVYISFDFAIIQRILELDPKANTQYLNGEKSPEELKAAGVRGADYHYEVFRKNPDWIQMAKNNNVDLNVWTVNKPEDMDWFLSQGFQFITTNEPEILLKKKK